MKLFIISSRFPYPLEKGDKLRLYYQIQELSKYFEIVLCCLTDQVVSELGMTRLRPYCRSIHVFRLHKYSVFFQVVKNYFNGLPAQVSYFLNPGIKEKIKDLIRSESPDHIYCQLIRAAEYVKDYPLPKTLDYMDCFSLSTYKRALNTSVWTRWFWNLESRLLKKYELAVYTSFNQHTIISSIDASYISGDNKDIPFTLVSNGLDQRFLKDANATRDIDILFFGNLSYFSNINAVEFLIKEILPALKRRNKTLRIMIAGAQPEKSLIKLIGYHPDSVTLQANVIDAKVIYKRAKIFVAPITLGTGQQNKVLEAIASGCEVVCSEDVSAGLPGLINYISLASSPDEYAELIIKKWDSFDQNRTLRNKAKDFVKENFSWEKNTAPLVELIKTTKLHLGPI
ncbi:MAG: glycosyltransferase [Saprospiraceae bacterium]